MSILHPSQIIVVANAAELARTAADHFIKAAQRNIADHGRFTVALSGGSTPKAMFALLAESPHCEGVEWERIFIFWSDERCVPPDHADSNYRMTKETLLSKVPLPSHNVFRIPGEKEPAHGAKEYSEQLRQFFQTEALPQFDLIFLGMGADGHTASLFPGTTALQAGTEVVAVENYVEKLQAYRITLTAATINQAQEVMFLVGGADKAATLKAVLQGDFQPQIYPSQLIQPVLGQLIWVVDEAAHQEIKSSE
ncbi:MAG: 6-phosphogluconolactonase [Acidobacteria bacterium]|nr:6-phosphogluconolactonase [Acidobacteriota bacterium]